jgi:hypothetical protein
MRWEAQAVRNVGGGKSELHRGRWEIGMRMRDVGNRNENEGCGK